MYEPIIIILSFLLTAFFTGSETALISVHKIRLKHWSKIKGNLGKEAAEFLTKPEIMLSTLLVGTNVMEVTFASFTSAYLGPHFQKAVVLFINTSLILVLGEIIPKAFFRDHATVIAQRVLIPLKIWYYIFFPITVSSSFIANSLTRLTHGDHLKKNLLFTKREMLALMAEGESEGSIEKNTRRLVSAIFAFSEAPVREAMTPRTEIVAVEKGSTVSSVMELVSEKGFSRIPVYEENLDNIIGFVNVLDIMGTTDPAYKIDSIIRPIPYVPETKKCDELLLELRGKKGHIAVVIDEYGGTAGLITLEDLLEEVVGDIYDEFDKHEQMYWKISDRSFIIDARMRIDDINKIMKLNLPQGDYETLGGLLLEHLERIPKAGEELTIKNLRCIVARANDKKIDRVKIIVLSSD
ncbi:MAG: HlyC/CorC family transporter [Gemmatimonadota bacterium]|nr:MAG: HlyC/CorC family transporter [Gemmatimonadota bacterium]